MSLFSAIYGKKMQFFEVLIKKSTCYKSKYLQVGKLFTKYEN